MIVVDCEQGSEEWHKARLGVVTASNFSRLLTPTGRLSKSADAYMARLLAEWLMGEPDTEYSGDYMADGYLRQPKAVEYYELTTGRTVKEVGFCYLDDRKCVGCSPDGLMEASNTPGGRGLEIKGPTGRVHLATLLADRMPNDHIPQVQGSMWVTGLPAWDFLSYHPKIAAGLYPIERDEVYIAQLAEVVEAFVEKMMTARMTLLERGFGPALAEVA